MAATFHDQPEMVGLSKINSGNDVIGGLRSNRISTWTGDPGVDPARALGSTRLITDIERVLQVFNYFFASRSGRVSRKKRFNPNQPAVYRLI